MDFDQRLHRVIPGGSHTYSKGSDQFPKNAPQILEKGKGVEVFGPDGKAFLDFGMGLRSVLIGYSEDEIDAKAIECLKRGMNLTRPTTVELEAAELFLELVPSAEMVKFTKNGSTAVTAAVKLARAYTGRKKVAFCIDHPFFSFDDWFIGNTVVRRGVPSEVSKLSLSFRYNDISSLESLIRDNPNEIACVILEPLASDCPKFGTEDSCCSEQNCSRLTGGRLNFLQQVQELCRLNGIVFVLDEMITGFRWGVGGAQTAFNVNPDLSTFGKAMANGYPLACVSGKREIMSLGSTDVSGQERVFFLSTTHGSDMASFGAFVANIDFMKKYPVKQEVWRFGYDLIQLMRAKAKEYGIDEYFKVYGPACSPRYITHSLQGENSLEFRTLFLQEMMKKDVMMPWISIAYRHDVSHLDKVSDALDLAFAVYSRGLERGPSELIEGEFIKPVFRRFN